MSKHNYDDDDTQYDEDEVGEILNEALEMDNQLVERVWPILEEVEEQFPRLDSVFALFINLIHQLYEDEWTPEELIQEVKTHHEIWLSAHHEGELH